MSKLPNAPLQEVSAQIKWHLKSEDSNKYDFFTADFYRMIEGEYPNRYSIAPDGIPIQLLINNPSHKFTKNRVDYPFVVVGPGIVGINVDDDNYFWEKFKEDLKIAFSPIFELVPILSDFDHIHNSLEYIDFFEFDFDSHDILDFLKEYLNTNISQTFVQHRSNSIDANFSYRDDSLGIIKFSFKKGKLNRNETMGLVVRTIVDSGIHSANLDDTLSWFDQAHNRSSELFKEMTKGKLYELFKG